MAGQEYIFNPCARPDKRLHTGLDPEVGSSLDYEYSVTQSPPGGYCDVKWWDGRLVSRASTKARNKVKAVSGAERGATPVFLTFPVFWDP